MKQQFQNYQSPACLEIVTDCLSVLCVSDPNSLGGYIDDVTPDYGEDD